VLSLYELPIVQELPPLHEPPSFTNFVCCHSSNNLHFHNNLPNTFPKPIHHLFCKPREAKHQCRFGNSVIGFVNTSSQWTFLRATPPSTITCFTKWYLPTIWLLSPWYVGLAACPTLFQIYPIDSLTKLSHCMHVTHARVKT